MSLPAGGGRIRRRWRIGGVVQGVGFRPFVYRLAREHALAGRVYNDAAGVIIEAEGSVAALAAFAAALPQAAPPAAVLAKVETEELAPQGGSEFLIEVSRQAGPPLAGVAPDLALCDDCRAELFEPADRRYLYPFINCTNCGPRYTIIEKIPYDRPHTTMRRFTMCPACQAEYDEPADRRFHAQPNACPRCGPHLQLRLANTGRKIGVSTPISSGPIPRPGLAMRRCSPPPGSCCARAGSWPSKGSAAFIWRWMPPTRRRCKPCVTARAGSVNPWP
ncbi:MAG: acylphosphatase [Desulfurivibrio sp.]|nr:acylphosphatase [Desulfurivibrio sp.]